MDTNRNPSTPKPPSPGDLNDDLDLTLDDYEEKPQSRPRLPDQRREGTGMEMGGQTVMSRPPVAPGAPLLPEPSVTVPAWQPVTDDEIAAFDLSAPAVAALPVAPGITLPQAPAPAPQAPAPRAIPELDTLEEFIATTAAGTPVGETPAAVRRALTMVEKICLGAGTAAVLGVCFWLVRSATSEANGVKNASETWPDLPIAGSIVTITEAAGNWRHRTETDRVAQMEVLLPDPGLKMPEMIPQVKFTIDSAASKTGYVRFLFKDSEGKPRGDTRVIHIAGGRIKDLGNGEIVKSATEASIYGSFGMADRSSYLSYTSSTDPRWSVEVAESSAYDAADKDWKVLDTFDVRDDLAP